MSAEARESAREASRVIWDWETEGRTRPASPSIGAQRRQGLLQGVGTLAFAGALFFFGFRHVASVAGTVGGIVLLAALLSPSGIYAAIQRAVGWLAERVGVGLNALLLGGIFFGFFVPFGWLFRRGKRDSLKRWQDAEAASYWVERTQESAPGSRRSQY